MQNLGVSLYGYAWRRERLGGYFGEYATEFAARSSWPPAKFQEYIRVELASMLQHAYRQVPYYSSSWRTLGITSVDLNQADILACLPTTPKSDLRADPRKFLANSARSERLHYYQSSGTTGTPITAICSADAHRRFIAAREARSFSWAGTSIRQPRSMIGGRHIVPRADSKPPFCRYNAAEKQVYFSAFHISPANAPHYVAALNRFQPMVLTGYAYAHAILAELMVSQGLQLAYSPKALILGSEKLTGSMKGVIQAAFGARAFEEYGCVENCVLATECEHGRLHVSPDFGLVEIVDEHGKATPPGTVGRLLCTSLLNPAQPLIRYEIGDLGAWSSEKCPCGRNHLPILQEIVGRLEDVVTGPDGRQMVRFHGVFVGLPHVIEGQVIQKELTEFIVRVVTLDGFGRKEETSIENRIRERLGDVHVTIERVKSIPRTEGGKFRAVISRLGQSLPDVSVQAGKPSENRQPGRKVGGPQANPLWLSIFHRLPSPARHIAATLHGHTLRSRRYGPETEKLVEAALDRDTWSSKKWACWTEENLGHLLEHAARQVPHYRRVWSRKGYEELSAGALSNWPILKKEVLRTAPEHLIAANSKQRSLIEEHTSGTTGTPLRLWFSRHTLRQWYALYEARVRVWNGLSGSDRWGHLGGQPVVAYDQSRPPFWVWNSALRQLYLSAMHIGPASGADYLSAIDKYQLAYLLGYASSISLLAQHALECGIQPALRLVITDAEPLHPKQRTLIQAGFGCSVRETYGMAEAVCAASECSAGFLHAWPDVGHIELLDDKDQPAKPGQIGRIVATGLLNFDMPLIRYDTGDLAQAYDGGEPCVCGRTLPRIAKLLGRNDDAVVTRDGRRLSLIDRIFEPGYDIIEAQIVQETLDRFVIRVVPGAQWNDNHGEALCRELGKLVGDAQITIQLVERMERTWAGKHRMIVSKVSKACETAHSG